MNVMKRAWEIAKEGQKKFGGKVKEFFVVALKMAWSEIKNPVKTVKEVAQMIQAKLGGTAKVNVWEKYGKKRIYVNKGFKQQVAMLEFDAQDNFIGKKTLGAMDLFGARQNGTEDELIAVYQVVEAIA